MVPCVTYAKGDHDISHCNNPVHCYTIEKADCGHAAAGTTNLLFCSQAYETVSELNRYLTIKSTDAANTDAYIVCPRVSNASWSPQLKGVVQVACLLWSQLYSDAVNPEQDFKCLIIYDPFRAGPGCIPTQGLPLQLKSLLGHRPEGAQLTFVFEGKVAGVRGLVLWDSGAAKPFISRKFARLQNWELSSLTPKSNLRTDRLWTPQRSPPSNCKYRAITPSASSLSLT